MILLKTILILILGAIIIGVPIAILFSLIYWGASLGSTKPWIKFDDFIALYNADPRKWDTSHDNPKCRKDDRYDPWGANYVRFKFHYIGYCRYHLWKFMKNRQEAKERQRQEYEKALEVLGVNMQQVIKDQPVVDSKDPRIKALAKDIVDYWNMGRKDKEKW